MAPVLEHLIEVSNPALGSMGRFLGNIHGHTHEFDVEGPYLNVSAEKLNYTPVHFDIAKAMLQERVNRKDT